MLHDNSSTGREVHAVDDSQYSSSRALKGSVTSIYIVLRGLTFIVLFFIFLLILLFLFNLLNQHSLVMAEDLVILRVVNIGVIPQVMEHQMTSSDTLCHALDTQFMTSWQVGCFLFPSLVTSLYCRNHSSHCTCIATLNSRLTETSVGWTREVHPAGMKIRSLLHSSATIFSLALVIWGQ